MTVDVVIPWRDTGCPHRARAWRWVEARWGVMHPDARLIVAPSPDGQFNIAAALNRGIRRATSDVVVLTGADVVLNPAVVNAAVTMAEHGRWVMLAARYRRLPRHLSDAVTERPADFALAGLPGEQVPTRCGWGPIAAPRSLLLEVGYDERFQGWGGEDDAFGHTASALHGAPARLDGTAHMLWHPRMDRHDHPGYQGNLALLRRYRAARLHPDRIRALIAERPAPRPCGFTSMGGLCDLGDWHPGAHRVAVCSTR